MAGQGTVLLVRRDSGLGCRTVQRRFEFLDTGEAIFGLRVSMSPSLRSDGEHGQPVVGAPGLIATASRRTRRCTPRGIPRRGPRAEARRPSPRADLATGHVALFDV